MKRIDEFYRDGLISLAEKRFYEGWNDGYEVGLLACANTVIERSEKSRLSNLDPNNPDAITAFSDHPNTAP